MSRRAGFRRHGVRRGGATLAAAVLACVAPGAALAGHPSPGAADGKVPQAVEDALGGQVTELPDGLYEVDPARGPSYTTHGPDTAADVRPDHGQNLGPGDPERPPVCASGDYHQHVLYAYREGSENRIDEVTGDIQASIRRMNAVLNEESLASGGVTADYRVLCDASDEIQVDDFETGAGTATFNGVVNAARAAGFDDPDVDYTIFFDYNHPQYCGVGHYSNDESLSVGNVNNRGGDYGMTYDGCWLGGTPMHENGHNQGAVQFGAPFSTGDGAHCWDENDVMCYADGGSLYPGELLDRCTDRLYFDCGWDSYFDAAPEACEYLATNWNMGSRLNRFVEFGGPEPAAVGCPAAPEPEPPPPADPGPDPVSSTPAPAEGPAQRLANRRELTDRAAPQGGWRRYTFRVPRRSSRLVVTLDCSADCADQLDLYARRGADASLTDHDCRAAGPGPDEKCKIRSPRRGTWHIGVHNAAGPGNSEYEIAARHRR